MYTLVSC